MGGGRQVRAPSRKGSRTEAELSIAGTGQLVKDALHAVHDDRTRDALRVEGDEGAGGRAGAVSCRVAAAHHRVAGEAAEAASRVRAHAAEDLVDEQVDEGLAVLDGVDIETFRLFLWTFSSFFFQDTVRL